MRVGELLSAVGRRLGVSHPAETGRLFEAWRDIVGDAVADHAEPTSLRAGVLRVRAESPAWATEIGYLAEEIRRRTNRAVGIELVAEVRVWTGSGPFGARRRASAAPSPGRPVRAALADPHEALERARRAWARSLGRTS